MCTLMKNYTGYDFTLFSVGNARQFYRKIGFKNASSQSYHDPNTTRGNATGPMRMTKDRVKKLVQLLDRLTVSPERILRGDTIEHMREETHL